MVDVGPEEGGGPEGVGVSVEVVEVVSPET